MKKTKLALMVLGMGIASGVFAADAPAKMDHGMLVNQAGMTLYTFLPDSDDKSNCNGGCAKIWPPVVVGKDAKTTGDFGWITREEGVKQLTYKGKPLYLYSADEKVGDKKGDGASNVWHIVSEKGGAAPAAAPAAAY